jgi:L,D-peptidoglycan transpeptidase YkuD (ErfK/YbiS/YcfS/YnhG family)
MLVYFLLYVTQATGAGPLVGAEASLAKAQQLIVVTTDGWDSAVGRLCRFERQGEAWQGAGECFSVVVGKKGLAWPAGSATVEAPTKREGDNKAPAGVFRLAQAMGYAAAPPVGTTFPYRAIVDDLHCVDDSGSSYYNRIVRATDVEHTSSLPWKSSELMRRKDNLYKWLLVVDYNREAPIPAGGSCIFLHVWRGAGKGTAGCTAMPEAKIIELITWLRPASRPALVQIPVAVYKEKAQSLGLPSLQ